MDFPALYLIMHRYNLEPYTGHDSRTMCPKCRHRRNTFKRYIDTKTGRPLADNVGRCDRQEQCGYHYTPRQYFADNPDAGAQLAAVNKRAENSPRPTATLILPWPMVEQTMKAYSHNNFVLFLAKLFGAEHTKELVMRYCIGTASHWPGATVFWQLDYHDRVRAGKIMLYNAHTGKRVKEPFNHITWVHALLTKSENEHRKSAIRQCFFGEHLLAGNPSAPVAIVESEKTAVIASGFYPGLVWLASGSLDGISSEKCKVLKDRRVKLFPDANGYAKWRMKAREMNLRYPAARFTVDDTFERTGTWYEQTHGLDIADRFIKELTHKTLKK